MDKKKLIQEYAGQAMVAILGNEIISTSIIKAQSDGDPETWAKTVAATAYLIATALADLTCKEDYNERT